VSDVLHESQVSQRPDGGWVADQPQRLRGTERGGIFNTAWQSDALRLIPRRAGHSRGPGLESGRSAAVSQTIRSGFAGLSAVEYSARRGSQTRCG